MNKLSSLRGSGQMHHFLRRIAVILPVVTVFGGGGVTGLAHAEAQSPSDWAGSREFRDARKDSGRIFFSKESDTIELRAIDASYERIIETAAGNQDVTIYFYCEDPALETAHITQRLSSTSFRNLLVEAIERQQPTSSFNFQDGHGDPVAELENAAALHVVPAGCERGTLPVRIFRPLRQVHPILGRPGAAIAGEDLATVLETEGPEARQAALRLAGRKDVEGITGLLEKGLADDDPAVVGEAARIVRLMARTRDMSALSGTLYKELQDKPYFDLVLALVKVDRDKAWPVVAAMARSKDDDVRAQAVRMMVAARENRGLEDLADIVATAKPVAAQQAAMAIGKIGGEEATDVLLDLLALQDPQRRAMAVQGIALLADGRREDVHARIMNEISNPAVPQEVLEALVSMRYTAPLTDLMAQSGVSDDLKIRVLQAIEDAATEEAIAPVEVALSDPSTGVRLQATEALMSLQVAEAVPLLIAASKDRDAEVRLAAVEGLGRLGYDRRSTEALEQRLDDNDNEVRLRALEAMARWGEPEQDVVDALLWAEREGPTDVAGKALEILHYWGYK